MSDKPTSSMHTVLAVKRGEQRLADLPAKQRAETRALLRSTTTTQLREFAGIQTPKRARTIGYPTHLRRTKAG